MITIDIRYSGLRTTVLCNFRVRPKILVVPLLFDCDINILYGILCDISFSILLEHVTFYVTKFSTHGGVFDDVTINVTLCMTCSYERLRNNDQTNQLGLNYNWKIYIFYMSYNE